MVNLGWNVGAILRSKETPNLLVADQQFELGYINDDGSVGLYPIDADGKAKDVGLVIVAQVDLTSKYRLLPTDKCVR